MPYSQQTVTTVRKWSDKTFSFATTRPNDFQFENGEFVTIGLRPEGKLIPRAYSIVSTNDKDFLEFLSIYVPDGPLTSRLVNVKEGDSIWVNSKATGSLTMKYIQPGRNLFLISTGTGLAPFMCLIRDPEVYDNFEKVILVHSVRTIPELAYKKEIESLSSDRLFYVPTVTREPFVTTQRGADLFRSGELTRMLNLPDVDPEHDRVMLCGNPAMNKEVSQFLEQRGWQQTSHRGVGNFTTEKAFVTRSED